MLSSRKCVVVFLFMLIFIIDNFHTYAKYHLIHHQNFSFQLPKYTTQQISPKNVRTEWKQDCFEKQSSEIFWLLWAFSCQVSWAFVFPPSLLGLLIPQKRWLHYLPTPQPHTAGQSDAIGSWVKKELNLSLWAQLIQL